MVTRAEDKVALEPPTLAREDDFLAAVRRSRRLHANLVTPPNSSARYRSYVEHSNAPNCANFFVVLRDSQDLVGVINIENIVRGYFHSAFLGYYGFVPQAGNGYMRAGLVKVIDYAFSELKLHRLEANIQPINERSIAIVRGLTFRLEGYSPKYLKISGRWCDHERWAILKEEWRGG